MITLLATFGAVLAVIAIREAGYAVENYQTYRINDEGERELLANFSATIITETHFLDGRSNTTTLTIEGQQPNYDSPGGKPRALPPIEIDATQFTSMSWVLPNWGVQAVIRPGSSIRDDLRTAIQLQSKPTIRNIYKHIGWETIDGEKAYVHAGGAITAKGNDPSVEVRLPNELSLYNLASDADTKEAIRATLRLHEITMPEITWPIMSAMLTPVFGQVDFGLHLTGRTGTFKSEVMSLFQSHYGAGMDARHLPGSWSSTGNALEAQAYYAANAAFVVDDFVPQGTAWQQRSYQATADKLIRSQGNQSGRARLTDTSNLQTTMYPTWDNTQHRRGHSRRTLGASKANDRGAQPRRRGPGKLTKAQHDRKLYPATMQALIRSLCMSNIDLSERAEEIRNQNLNVGHTRTPSMLGRLIATIEAFINWAKQVGAITDKEAKVFSKNAYVSILEAGKHQQSYLEAMDPCDLFTAAVRQVLATGLGHLRTLNGGIPLEPTILGWTAENGMGEMPTYKSRGPCIGWVDWNDDTLYMDVTAGYNLIRKIAGPEISITKQTLFKRLKDAGVLSRSDDVRQRNTIRITAEQHPRQALAMVLSTTLDTQEKPQDL